MNQGARKTKAIEEHAAAWIALKAARPMTLAEQADLADWLARDPRHSAAHAELESAWVALDKLAAYPHSADAPADQDLLARATTRTVLRWPVTLAAAAVIALALVWFSPRHGNRPATGAAAVASSPVVRLSDGTAVALNGDSEVQERFSDAERRVTLVRGEAHFQVVPDRTRPFIVEAKQVSIRAIGTAFNVRIGSGDVDVVVSEGAVQVAARSGAGGTAEAVSLAAGERTRVSFSSAEKIERPKVTPVSPSEMNEVLAWQRGRFVFDEMPLAEIVSRLNRQAKGSGGSPSVVIDDPRIADMRISGRVRWESVENFVEALESSFGIVAAREDGKILLRKAETRP